jgi:serine/threonine-protein kinase
MLHHLLGSGGMAQVWEATDETLGRNVAVKVLHPHLAGDESFVLRFRREAIAAARLSHPNIVSVYDTCSDGSVEAIVMELLDARTLRSVLDERGTLDIASIDRIGIRLLDALEAAHRAGVVHRDVKPSNILLCSDGRVKIADFGIAKAEDNTDMTREGSFMGTASYLAPEQLTNEDVDGRTDLFALGVVLYECLTGQLPFRGDTDTATALSRLHTAARDPRQYRPDIPGWLATSVLRALSRRPEDRFGNAADFRAALSWDDAVPELEVPADFESEEVYPEPAAPEGFGRSERSWLVPALFILLIGTSVVVAYLLLRNTTDGTETTPPSTSSTPTEEVPATIASVSTFDPDGRGEPGENDEDAGLAVDGDLETAWTTESYDSRSFFGSKNGVGLVVDLSALAAIESLRIDASTNGWSGEVHLLGVDDEPNPDAEPAATLVEVRDPVELSFEGEEAQSILIWITDLGESDDRHRVEIAEVSVAATVVG